MVFRRGWVRVHRFGLVCGVGPGEGGPSVCALCLSVDVDMGSTQVKWVTKNITKTECLLM